jgi:hypothetical protein
VDPKKNPEAVRARVHQERLAKDAAARAMVKEGSRDDPSSRPSALKRLVARLRRSGR